MNEFEWTDDVNASRYKELIAYFENKFNKEVLDVVFLDKNSWPHDEGPYRENCVDVNVDGNWIVCDIPKNI